MLDRFTGYKRLLALAALNGGGASIIERTATGNPVTFDTDLARPLKSLILNLSPVQQGSGDPSPTNVRDIVPWTGVKVWNGGKNLLDIESGETGGIDSDGQEVSTSDNFRSDFISAVPSQEYSFSCINSNIQRLYWYTKDKTFISPRIVSTNGEVHGTAPDNAYYARCVMVQSNAVITKEVAKTMNPQLEAGDTATAYEPYVPITETDILFPSPVYGGTLDVVSGVMTVEWVAKKLSDFSWTYTTTGGANAFRTGRLESQMKTSQSAILLYCDSLNPVSPVTTYGGMASKADKSIFQLSASDEKRIIVKDNDHTVVNDFLETYGNVMVAYPLATPQEIQLTPEQISALRGSNTLWSDGNGSMTVVYLLTESFGDEHPISGGLGSGLLGGGLGSGTGEPDEPVEPDEPGEPDQPGDE